MSTFEIYRKKNRLFYYNLRMENGEIIITSAGYTAKHNCRKAIEAVRASCGNNERFVKKKAKNKQYYFTLKASNGLTIAESEVYTTVIARDNSMESLKMHAPNAGVIDLT